MVDIVWEAPENEVLSIGKVEPYIPCDQCGELVSEMYLRLVGKSHMCIPCSDMSINTISQF
jgi:formylmethanofuran dehydrogenase subunit E